MKHLFRVTVRGKKSEISWVCCLCWNNNSDITWVPCCLKSAGTKRSTWWWKKHQSSGLLNLLLTPTWISLKGLGTWTLLACHVCRLTPWVWDKMATIFKCIFFNENLWISLKISLKFVPKVQINNIPALVQIIAWCRPGDKPLSGPMMVSLLMHIYVSVSLNELMALIWFIHPSCTGGTKVDLSVTPAPSSQVACHWHLCSAMGIPHVDRQPREMNWR